MCVGFCTERRGQLKNKFPTDAPDSITLWKSVFLFLRIRKEINVWPHSEKKKQVWLFKGTQEWRLQTGDLSRGSLKQKDTSWSIYCSRINERWWTLMDGAETVPPPGTKDQRWFIHIQPATDDQSQVHAWGGGFGIVILTNSNLHEAVLLWQTTPFSAQRDVLSSRGCRAGPRACSWTHRPETNAFTLSIPPVRWPLHLHLHLSTRADATQSMPRRSPSSHRDLLCCGYLSTDRLRKVCS